MMLPISIKMIYVQIVIVKGIVSVKRGFHNLRKCDDDLIENNQKQIKLLEEAYITNQADKWSISIYNEDSDYKYVSMVRSNNDASNLGQVRGTGVEHLHYMLDNRFVYCVSI